MCKFPHPHFYPGNSADTARGENLPSVTSRKLLKRKSIFELICPVKLPPFSSGQTGDTSAPTTPVEQCHSYKVCLLSPLPCLTCAAFLNIHTWWLSVTNAVLKPASQSGSLPEHCTTRSPIHPCSRRFLNYLDPTLIPDTTRHKGLVLLSSSFMCILQMEKASP